MMWRAAGGWTWLLVVVMALAMSDARSSHAVAAEGVDVVSLPEGALVPDVAVDARGAVHMVYGVGEDAWYVRSADNGATFTPAVQVNPAGSAVELRMGERGPKLALGREGAVHVVWMDRWSPGAKCFVRHARRVDGGKGFEPAQQISPTPGVDGATLAADGEGTVLVFWHVFEEPKPVERDAHRIWLARSQDNGASFAPAERLRIENRPELACSMCLMRARIDANGTAYLAFRTAEKDIRDFYVLRGPKGENRFTAVRVNQDNWQIDHCPMCGPELTLDAATGRALCAFMSRNRVYWAALDRGGEAFQLHVATPAEEEDEIYPAAVVNDKGQVLMVWQVGPMSVSGNATVKWAIYEADGRFTGQQGTLGVSTSGTKPAAFAGTDGRFHVVTTAK